MCQSSPVHHLCCKYQMKTLCVRYGDDKDLLASVLELETALTLSTAHPVSLCV